MITDISGIAARLLLILFRYRQGNAHPSISYTSSTKEQIHVSTSGDGIHAMFLTTLRFGTTLDHPEHRMESMNGPSIIVGATIYVRSLISVAALPRNLLG